MTVNLRRTATFALCPLIAICVGAMSSTAQAQSGGTTSPLKVGAALPNWTLTGMDGQAVSLTGVVKGKNTVLVFCAPQDLARVNDVQSVRGLLNNRGYQVVLVSNETPNELKRLASEQHLSFKLLSDLGAATFKSDDSSVLLTNTKGCLTFVRTDQHGKAGMKGSEIVKVVDGMLWSAEDPWIEAGTEDVVRRK